jgi:restriction endonuclease S subunit
MTIPLPLLEEQERIVAELEGYRKVIEGSRQILNSYKPTIRIDPSWPVLKIGDVSEINPKESGLAKLSPDIQVSFIPMADVAVEATTVLPSQTRKLKEVVKGYTNFRQNDVLLAKITPCFENGKVAIAGPLINDLGFGSTEFIVIRCDPKKLLPPLLLLYVSDNDFRQVGRLNMTGSAGQQRVPADFVRGYEIPRPPLDVQRQIVAELEAERKLVEANRELIVRMEAKIKTTLDEVWGEERNC